MRGGASLWSAVSLVTALGAAAPAVHAAEYPVRPIRVVVPFPAGGNADILARIIETMFNLLPIVLPHTRAGRLRALAVTASKRAPALPQVPTFAEAGIPDFEAGSWYGVLAPAGTPKDIIAKLHSEISRILALADVKQRLAAEGAEPIGNTPEQFAEQIRRDSARWAKVAREARVRVD